MPDILHNSSAADQFDYIISGAGCAGLSLAVHLIQSGKFDDKKILIVDKEEKTKNDRTWCFWETEPGLFEDIVYKKWEKAWFHGEEYSKLLELNPYHYKLIRGIDFYKYCFNIIRQQKNITVQFGEVQHLVSTKEETSLVINGQKYYADYIFNSILFDKPVLKKKEYWLLQHFKGWIIEANGPFFDSSTATLMDFRVGQQYGTAFVYCMPFTTSKALVEYTLFTEKVLHREEYDLQLQNYIGQHLGIDNFTIIGVKILFSGEQ